MRRFTFFGLQHPVYQCALVLWVALGLSGCQTLPVVNPTADLLGERVLVRFSSPVDLRGQTVLIEQRDDGLSLSGYAGCNLYWGSASLETDGMLSVGPLFTTRRACKERDLSDSENAFVAALSEARFEVTHSGVELVLSNDESTMVFAEVR